MNEPAGKSLKELYDKSHHKQFMLIIRRWITVYNIIKYESSSEIHTPRNSNEIYTYYSDKYWAKVIYGINYLIENNNSTTTQLHESIHLGAKINLIYYWYPILKYQNRLPKLEIKYYLLSVGMILSLKYINFEKFLLEDKMIVNILDIMKYNILNINFNKEDSIKLLKLIITNPEPELNDMFYNYLIQDLNNPCIESENCEEISNIILSY
jgi:hypothetical protein